MGLQEVSRRQVDNIKRVDRLNREVYGEGEHDGLRVGMQRLEDSFSSLVKDQQYERADRAREWERFVNEQERAGRRFDQVVEVAKAMALNNRDPVVRLCVVLFTAFVGLQLYLQYVR
jgi:hypothetical protein